MSETTTIRDLSTTDKVIEFLEEVLGEISYDKFIDYAEQYGEPGYQLDSSATTPLVILGSYWCRCGNYAEERSPDRPMHPIEVHHQAEFDLLAEQGVEFEWDDEWVVVNEFVDGQYVSNAYRTQCDSYHWQPSAVLDDDCEWMTPHTPDEEWVEWALNNPERCIPATVLDALDPTRIEGQDWLPFSEDSYDHGLPTRFESGWHPHQTADPKAIDAAIRDRFGDNVNVVFMLDETSQFYIGFSAFYSLSGELA